MVHSSSYKFVTVVRQNNGASIFKPCYFLTRIRAVMQAACLPALQEGFIFQKASTPYSLMVKINQFHLLVVSFLPPTNHPPTPPFIFFSSFPSPCFVGPLPQCHMAAEGRVEQ